MKQFLNITTFIFVLSIPFALSSQTRKAIPAGRYEALSGVKNSRSSAKSAEETDTKSASANLVWNEALKYLPTETENISYYSSGDLDLYWSELIANRGIAPSKKIIESTLLIFSNDLNRDKDLLKSLKRNSVVILKDKQSLKELMAQTGHFEVLAYQASEDASHLYLLRAR